MKNCLRTILILLSFSILIGVSSYYDETDLSHASASDVIISDTNVDRAVNPVVFVRPFGTDEYATTDFSSKLDKMYNSSNISMRNYFLTESLGKFDVTTNFIGENKSLELENEKQYYLPKYKFNNLSYSYDEINVLGYDNRYYVGNNVVAPETSGAKPHIEHYYREQKLIREICDYIFDNFGQNIPVSDYNQDGVIDSITFLIDCEYLSESVWNTILWPHMSVVYSLDIDKLSQTYYCPSEFYRNNGIEQLKEVYFSNLKLRNYNLLTTGYIFNETLSYPYSGMGNVGVLCHEYLHNIGLYDYYSYIDNDYQSVGELDILGVTKSIPQLNLSYMRQKLGWLEEGVNIVAAEKSDNYTLQATTSNSEIKAIKIVPNDYSTRKEYFMLEMRSNATGGFDSQLSDSGLVIYRINEKNGYRNAQGEIGNISYGNMYSSYVGAMSNELQTDEVYVYRCGAGETITSQDNSLAILNGKTVNSVFTYNKGSFGTRDESVLTKTFDMQNGLSSIFASRQKGTTIYYSDGSNSKIFISGIILSADKQSVSFRLDFDDESEKLVAEKTTCNISQYYGNRRIIEWNNSTRVGEVTVLVVEYDNELVKVNNDEAEAKFLPTKEEMKVGAISGYTTVMKSVTPISFKKAELEQTDKNVAIFCMFDDGQTQVIKFCGVIKNKGQGILQTLFEMKYFKAIAIGLVALCSVSLFLAVIVIVMKIKRKNNILNEDSDL